MKSRFRFLFFVMLFSALAADAQAQRLPLDKTIFRNNVRDSAWFLEDSTRKNQPEFFILSFARDTLVVAYINLLEGGGSNYSKYDCTYRANFMEVKARKWQPFDDSVKVSDMPPKLYLYAYRKSPAELMVLFSSGQKKMDDALLQEKDWQLFKMVK